MGNEILPSLAVKGAGKAGLLRGSLEKHRNRYRVHFYLLLRNPEISSVQEG